MIANLDYQWDRIEREDQITMKLILARIIKWRDCGLWIEKDYADKDHNWDRDTQDDRGKQVFGSR